MQIFSFKLFVIVCLSLAGLVEVFQKLSEFPPYKNQQVSTLEFLGKQYIVSFDFLFFRLGNNYQSILHLTIGSDNSVYGDRTPAVWLINNGFHIASAISGNSNNYKNIHPPLAAKRWMRFEISQIWKNNKVNDFLLWGQLMYH